MFFFFFFLEGKFDYFYDYSFRHIFLPLLSFIPMFSSSLFVHGNYGHSSSRENDVCFYVFLHYLKLMKFCFHAEMVKTNYPKAVEGVEWKKDEETSKFLCLFEGCAKEIFTNENYLVQHLQWDHMKILSTLQLDKKSKSTSKK